MAKKRALNVQELAFLRECRLRGSLGYPVYSGEKKVVQALIKRGYVEVNTKTINTLAFTTHEGNIVLAEKGPYVVEAEVAFAFAQKVEARVNVWRDPYYPVPYSRGVAFPHVWQTAVSWALRAGEAEADPRISYGGAWGSMFRFASTAIVEFCVGNHAKAEAELDMVDYWGRQIEEKRRAAGLTLREKPATTSA